MESTRRSTDQVLAAHGENLSRSGWALTMVVLAIATIMVALPGTRPELHQADPRDVRGFGPDVGLHANLRFGAGQHDMAGERPYCPEHRTHVSALLGLTSRVELTVEGGR